jgi:mono/diheme cytochrome c family protein
MKFSLASVALVASSPLALTVALASVACSSSNNSSSDSSDDAGNGADTSVGNQDSGNGNDSASPTLTFSADIYAPIIEHHCVGCHGFAADGGAGSGIAFGKLDLSSVDAGYANLVNVAAAGAACGSEDGSLLYLKVDGFTTAPPCGSPMPKSGEIPDGGQAVVAQQIQTWIDQGAQP